MAAWAIETGHQPELHRISANREHDRHRLTCGLRCARRGDITRCRDYDNAFCYKLRCECGQSLIVAIRPAFLDANVASLDKAGSYQALAKGIRIKAVGVGRCAIQEAYQRHLLL